MLNDADASGFKKVYLAMGFTDLRRGIDGLATIVRFQFKLDPYDKNTRDSIMVHSGGPARQMRQWRSQTTSTVC